MCHTQYFCLYVNKQCNNYFYFVAVQSESEHEDEPEAFVVESDVEPDRVLTATDLV